MNVTLRRAETADAPQLLALSRTTFIQAFLSGLDQSEALQLVAARFSEDRALAELSNPAVWTIFVEVAVGPAGYAQLWLDKQPSIPVHQRAAELRRFYILSTYHGRGMSDALMAAVGSEAEAEGVASLWLGVSESNVRAIRFYSKWGFHDIGSHTCPSDGTIDRIMATHLPLRRLAA